MRDHAVQPRGRLVRFFRRLWLAGCALACGLVVPAVASAQNGDNVLVVINASSPASIKVGEYYASVRKVPAKQVVRITASTAETVARDEYERTIEQPISAWLARHSLQDQVLYLVLTKGVPLRIDGTAGREGTAASVDSELALLYRRLVGVRTTVVGRVENPYFLNEGAVSEAKPFTRYVADIYLVTRLDGYTVEDVIGLIDRASAPARDGKIVIDQSGASVGRIGDRWLQEAADRVQAMPGERALLETTGAPATTSAPVLGYFSWGSNDPANRTRRVGVPFANGAIAGMFVSTDGRTFVEPPADWVPGTGRATGSESLAGDLIREGVTGVVANVSEPYLDATARPQIFFPAYLAGFNLAESFYLALPVLGWQGIVVGDPLCAPFQHTPLRREAIDKGMDPVTELPALFAERRLARLTETGLNVEGLRILLKADARLARDEGTDIEPLLKRAVEIEPRLTVASLRLAAANERRGEYDQAIERYRSIIAVESENVVALNNLAYALAERRQKPQDALPFAQKAYRLAPVPEVADTLGWVYHLQGDDESAATWLEKAVAGAPNQTDVLIHAAIVHAALNDLQRAREELRAAEKIDPAIGARADVKALRARLKLDFETRAPLLVTVLKAIGPPGSIPFIAFCALIGLGLAYVWPRSSRLARAWMWFVVIAHTILALPLVANSIAGRLPTVKVADAAVLQRLDTVILLDGDNRRGRVRGATLAATASPAAAVVILGGTPWLGEALAEAGIDPRRITYDYRPEDTRQQMDELRRLVGGHPPGRSAVVASRLQMPRVAALARAAGFQATLVPSPIDTEPATSGWRTLVPSYYALRVSRDAIYEHAALAYYEWRGWICTAESE